MQALVHDPVLRLEQQLLDQHRLTEPRHPAVRFHDLRHTFASHLIVDLGLDSAQVSRILGHARITITLDTYTPVR
jgi:integrase